MPCCRDDSHRQGRQAEEGMARRSAAIRPPHRRRLTGRCQGIPSDHCRRQGARHALDGEEREEIDPTRRRGSPGSFTLDAAPSRRAGHAALRRRPPAATPCQGQARPRGSRGPAVARCAGELHPEPAHCPGVDSTPEVPPIRSIARRTIASPTPVPGTTPRDGLSRWNSPRTRSWYSARSRSRCPRSRAAPKRSGARHGSRPQAQPPGRENFTALETRFVTTWCSIDPHPTTHGRARTITAARSRISFVICPSTWAHDRRPGAEGLRWNPAPAGAGCTPGCP